MSTKEWERAQFQVFERLFGYTYVHVCFFLSLFKYCGSEYSHWLQEAVKSLPKSVRQKERAKEEECRKRTDTTPRATGESMNKVEKGYFPLSLLASQSHGLSNLLSSMHPRCEWRISNSVASSIYSDCSLSLPLFIPLFSFSSQCQFSGVFLFMNCKNEENACTKNPVFVFSVFVWMLT